MGLVLAIDQLWLDLNHTFDYGTSHITIPAPFHSMATTHGSTTLSLLLHIGSAANLYESMRSCRLV